MAYGGDDEASPSGGTDADAAMWLEKASRETQPTSLPTATNLLERSLRASPDRAQRISRTIDVAHLYLLGGPSRAEAESTCTELLATPQAELEPAHELAARGILGAVYALRGPLHVGAAIAEFDASTELAGPNGAAGHNESIIAESYAGKAMVLLYAGDSAQAIACAQAAIASATAAGNRSARSRAEEALALAALTQLDVEGARAHVKESLAWFSPSNGPWAMLITPHLTASMVYVALGDIDAAIEVCQAGLDGVFGFGATCFPACTCCRAWPCSGSFRATLRKPTRWRRSRNDSHRRLVFHPPLGRDPGHRRVRCPGCGAMPSSPVNRSTGHRRRCGTRARRSPSPISWHGSSRAFTKGPGDPTMRTRSCTSSGALSAQPLARL